MVIDNKQLAERIKRYKQGFTGVPDNLNAGVSLATFKQNIEQRLDYQGVSVAPEKEETFKFSGDWFTPVLRQNWASTTSQSLSRIPLVFNEATGLEKKLSRAELQAKYGDPIGFNFREDMSERRAKLIADDYKQQLRDAEIASNFEGADWENKLRFTAPTIIANLPDAAIETAVVWMIGTLLAPSTGGASLVGAGAVTAARGATLASKISKVLLTTSDIYKTGTKGRQVLRSLGHSALIENGVGAIATGFNELRQGADLKQASQIAGTQLAIGAVATPVMVGLGKLGQEGFKLASKRINKYVDAVRPEKQLADIASDIGGKVELDNVRLDSDITRTTNLGRSIATLEEMYTPDRLEDIGGLIDVVNRTDGVELDFSKPIIRGMDETLGDVVDNIDIVATKPKAKKTLKGYEGLINKGFELGNKVQDVDTLINEIETVASKYKDAETAYRNVLQGLQDNEKIDEDVFSQIQERLNIAGVKRPTIERIMDAPFTESELKGVGLQKRGEEIGELATSEAEFIQAIDVIASNHPDPAKAKKKLLLGASKTFDAESVDIEKVTTELEADDAFYGGIVKEDPLGNVIFEAPEPLAIKVDEPATDFYVKQAERLDGLHGANEQRVAFKEAVDELNAMTRDVDEFANRPPTQGNIVKAFDNDGTVYNLAYRVVEMDDLIPSNTKDLKPNPNYPSELQPRDRTREASRDQINSIAQKLVPEKLAESPNISDGSPIVGEDLVVESGNGRTLALQKAYDSIPQKATAYKDFLVSNAGNYGIDAGAIEGMKQPVLVRVNQNNVDRVAFTKKANESTLASMSIIEQAKSDASKLDENILRSLKPDESGDFNAGFIKRFINEIVPDSERGMLLTADAELNNLGLKRIENAIVAKAIDVPEAQKAIANMLDSAEPEMRNMGKAILNTAPIMISTKQMIADGIRKPLDISGDIAVTVSKLLEIKSKKLNVEKYYAQGTLFDDGLTLTQNYLMQIFEKYNRSPKNLEALIKGVYDAIDEQGDPRQASLFALEEKTTADIIKDVYNKMEQDIQDKKNQSLQEEGLFDVKEYKNKIQPLVERGLDTPYKAIESEVPRLEPEPPSEKLEPSIKASVAAGLSDFSYDNPTLIDDMYKQYMENGEDVSILEDAIQQFKQTQGDVDALMELMGKNEKFEKIKPGIQCKGMNL